MSFKPLIGISLDYILIPKELIYKWSFPSELKSHLMYLLKSNGKVLLFDTHKLPFNYKLQAGKGKKLNMEDILLASEEINNHYGLPESKNRTYTNKVYKREECVFKYCPTPETCKEFNECHATKE